jgi:hypothetical protein
MPESCFVVGDADFRSWPFLLVPMGVSAQNTGMPTHYEVTGVTGSAISSDLQTATTFRWLPGSNKPCHPGRFRVGRGSYLEDYIRFEPGVFIQSAQGSEDTKVSIRVLAFRAMISLGWSF